jgi:hypothetical protein
MSFTQNVHTEPPKVTPPNLRLPSAARSPGDWVAGAGAHWRSDVERGGGGAAASCQRARGRAAFRQDLAAGTTWPGPGHNNLVLEELSCDLGRSTGCRRCIHLQTLKPSGLYKRFHVGKDTLRVLIHLVYPLLQRDSVSTVAAHL